MSVSTIQRIIALVAAMAKEGNTEAAANSLRAIRILVATQENLDQLLIVFHDIINQLIWLSPELLKSLDLYKELKSILVRVISKEEHTTLISE